MKGGKYSLPKFLLVVVVVTLVVVALSSCVSLSASSIPEPTSAPAGVPVSSSLPQSSSLGTKLNGNLSVQLFSTPSPPAGGNNSVRALVTISGQPVSDAKVSFDVDMTNMSMGKKITPAVSSGEGLYSGQVLFSMLGPWRLIVNVERAGQTNSVRFDFYVNSR